MSEDNDAGIEALQWPLIAVVALAAIALLVAAVNAKDICSFP